MLRLEDLGSTLGQAGFGFFSGVPCSYLKGLINYATTELRYVASINEGDAVAACAGATLGGVKSAVLMQNSGLPNAMSPLASLLDPFRIPILGFVSLRGGPDDEPQHALLGRVTGSLLDLMGVAWEHLSPEIGVAREQVARAAACVERGRSFFFLVKKGTLEPYPLAAREPVRAANEEVVERRGPDQSPRRWQALAALHELCDERTVCLATTGYTSRELCQIGDCEQYLYMVGSMGCVSSLGLGLALARPDLQVIAIDGDGALLMRLGALATNSFFGPDNLLHVLLDNQQHESTGGQPTHSGNVDFVRLAAACGYRRAIYLHDLDELRQEVLRFRREPRTTFLHLRVGPGALEKLGRPKLAPHEVKARLTAFLNRDGHDHARALEA